MCTRLRKLIDANAKHFTQEQAMVVMEFAQEWEARGDPWWRPHVDAVDVSKPVPWLDVLLHKLVTLAANTNQAREYCVKRGRNKYFSLDIYCVDIDGAEPTRKAYLSDLRHRFETIADLHTTYEFSRPHDLRALLVEVDVEVDDDQGPGTPLTSLKYGEIIARVGRFEFAKKADVSSHSHRMVQTVLLAVANEGKELLVWTDCRKVNGELFGGPLTAYDPDDFPNTALRLTSYGEAYWEEQPVEDQAISEVPDHDEEIVPSRPYMTFHHHNVGEVDRIRGLIGAEGIISLAVRFSSVLSEVVEEFSKHFHVRIPLKDQHERKIVELIRSRLPSLDGCGIEIWVLPQTGADRKMHRLDGNLVTFLDFEQVSKGNTSLYAEAYLIDNEDCVSSVPVLPSANASLMAGHDGGLPQQPSQPPIQAQVGQFLSDDEFFRRAKANNAAEQSTEEAEVDDLPEDDFEDD